MVPPVLWNAIRHDNPDDWEQFVGLNLTSHRAILQSIAGATGGQSYPQSQFLTQSFADQLDHWREHVTMATLQGTKIPTLQELMFNPKDDQSFSDFLSNHAFYHIRAEYVAGLT